MIKALSLLTVAVLMQGCKIEGEFSTWPCNFAYDNSQHLDQTLNASLNPNSTGTFCRIWEDVVRGEKRLYFKNNMGAESYQPEAAIEKEANYVLGLNNGIYIGFASGVFDQYGNFAFVAYDVQCPNCVRRTNNTLNPTYAINVDSKGIGTCRECGNQYDLNSGGIVIKGAEGDKGMERYRNAFTSGPNGHVSVHR